MSQSTQRPSSPPASKSSTIEQVKQHASNLTDQARAEAGKTKALGEKKIRAATESVKATSRDYAKQKKTQAASEIGVLRDAVQKAADKLIEENHEGVAGYVSAAAEQLDRLRESIEERSVGDLVGEAQRVARKHPEIVYGGMFVAGLALMRFLKASSDADTPDREGKRVSETNPQRMNRGQQTPRGPAVPRDSQLPRRQTPRTANAFSDTVVTNPNYTA
jgi:hypothetical protein